MEVLTAVFSFIALIAILAAVVAVYFYKKAKAIQDVASEEQLYSELQLVATKHNLHRTRNGACMLKFESYPNLYLVIDDDGAHWKLIREEVLYDEKNINRDEYESIIRHISLFIQTEGMLKSKHITNS